MTIYGLIDFGNDAAAWTLFSGASILQGGNPYFVPDFARRFEARPSLALKIGKLGKGFAPRFAYRYVESVAPCAIFVASDLLDQLRRLGYPWTAAICYDRSLALGQFIKTDFERLCVATTSISIETEGRILTKEWIAQAHRCQAADAISAIARYNTLKTGDIILLPMGEDGLEIAPGMKATLSIGDEVSAKFNIR